MASHSGLALFCESAREEVEGTISLIGIIPDNVNVPAFPGTFARLVVYVRLNFSVDYKLSAPVSVTIEAPHGDTISQSMVPADLFSRARDEAIDRGSPIIGIILTFRMDNVPIRSPGLLIARATFGDESIICGALAIKGVPST